MAHPETHPTVLVAPLDWGLGHATRCVPVVHELLRQGCKVVLAGEGKTDALLRTEFPNLPLLHLPGYRVSYASSGWGLVPKIVAQIPKLLSAIKNEQVWLQKVVLQHKINVVISDNRYGLHHPDIHSILLTHQLRIKAPLKPLEALLQQLNYRYLQCFDECWVPDAEASDNLAGELSHPAMLPAVPVTYLGPLSRFNEQEPVNGNTLLMLLSGPEPQRSLFEKLLLQELKNYTQPVVFVRGLPAQTSTLNLGSHVTVFNHLPSAELEEKMRNASFVIARCGYSTVMDISVLKKRSVLVPTPGQTEQQYLAKHLMAKNIALCVPQTKFRLQQALALAQAFPYLMHGVAQNHLSTAVENLLAAVSKKK